MNGPASDSTVEYRITNAQDQLRRAEDILQTAADYRTAMGAVEAVIDACRSLVGIVREQQREIARLKDVTEREAERFRHLTDDDFAALYAAKNQV